MRGFLVGSFVLIVLQTVLQPGATSRLDSAQNLSQRILVRALSGDVAGLPQHIPVQQKLSPQPQPSGGGGTPRYTTTPVPAPGVITV